MPRFLETYMGRFVPELADASGVLYAYLSHTWRSAEEGGKQKYDDIVILQPTVGARTWKHLHSVDSAVLHDAETEISHVGMRM
ncbi:hypothetical protein C2E23DRAFT_832178 [Lenzites betulinus]|nr:hypothetical protein C2E23DRAFT_832178 [Lenzites betulinus]